MTKYLDAESDMRLGLGHGPVEAIVIGTKLFAGKIVTPTILAARIVATIVVTLPL